MRVYVPGVMMLNFVVELLLISGTNRLSGRFVIWWRCLAAAALGGIFSGLCLLPALGFLMSPVCRWGSIGAMAALAFGWAPGCFGMFVLLRLALEGIVAALGGGSLWALAAGIGGLWLLCRVGISGQGTGGSRLPLVIRHGGQQVRLTALRDTGNTLRDPITGEQVLIIGPEAATRLTGLTREQLRSPLDTMARSRIPGLRLIPYRAVGQPGGMLLALRFGWVQVGRRRGSALVAFAPEEIGAGEGYQALTGGVI